MAKALMRWKIGWVVCERCGSISSLYIPEYRTMMYQTIPFCYACQQEGEQQDTGEFCESIPLWEGVVTVSRSLLSRWVDTGKYTTSGDKVSIRVISHKDGNGHIYAGGNWQNIVVQYFGSGTPISTCSMRFEYVRTERSERNRIVLQYEDSRMRTDASLVLIRPGYSKRMQSTIRDNSLFSWQWESKGHAGAVRVYNADTKRERPAKKIRIQKNTGQHVILAVVTNECPILVTYTGSKKLQLLYNATHPDGVTLWQNDRGVPIEIEETLQPIPRRRIALPASLDMEETV